MITLHLNAETEAQLAAFASLHGQSVEETVREMIELSLADTLPAREFKPNAETLESFAQYERGEYESFNTVEELMADLHAKD
ncbi:MAG: type II toxin-antitoxin system antitoxin, RelB/DinJ family [Alphaproteobacteria bacterium]|nr:type II toxin-antitoxin system antitoxin, RelB/DinJ family [Alphaproteobacteria bacterium]